MELIIIAVAVLVGLIVFLYFVFSMKILGAYVAEFHKRGISFNYAR